MKEVPLYSSERWGDERYPYVDDDFASAFKLAWCRLGSEFCEDGAMCVHGNQVVCWIYESRYSMEVSLWQDGRMLESHRFFSRKENRGKNEGYSPFITLTGMFSWMEFERSRCDHATVGTFTYMPEDTHGTPAAESGD